jgi:hypothetical protein
VIPETVAQAPSASASQVAAGAATGRTLALADDVAKIGAAAIVANIVKAIVRTSLDMSFPSHRAPAMNFDCTPLRLADSSRYLGLWLVRMPQSVVWATPKWIPHNEKTPSYEGVFSHRFDV